jgi:hypothetical protein
LHKSCTGKRERARGIVACRACSYRDATWLHSQELLQVSSKLELHVIPSADLQRFARALFEAAGVAPPMADQWAKSLVWANLRGVDSHGVLRIPGYIERLKSKAINPAPDMRVEQRSGALAVLEADRAPGAVAMAKAMEEAIARAREVHVGWCAARNITHAGAVGYFALQAANAGMVGIVMSASGPMMTYRLGCLGMSGHSRTAILDLYRWHRHILEYVRACPDAPGHPQTADFVTPA